MATDVLEIPPTEAGGGDAGAYDLRPTMNDDDGGDPFRNIALVFHRERIADGKISDYLGNPALRLAGLAMEHERRTDVLPPNFLGSRMLRLTGLEVHEPSRQ